MCHDGSSYESNWCIGTSPLTVKLRHLDRDEPRILTEIATNPLSYLTPSTRPPILDSQTDRQRVRGTSVAPRDTRHGKRARRRLSLLSSQLHPGRQPDTQQQQQLWAPDQTNHADRQESTENYTGQ